MILSFIKLISSIDLNSVKWCPSGHFMWPLFPFCEFSLWSRLGWHRRGSHRFGNERGRTAISRYENPKTESNWIFCLPISLTFIQLSHASHWGKWSTNIEVTLCSIALSIMNRRVCAWTCICRWMIARNPKNTNSKSHFNRSLHLIYIVRHNICNSCCYYNSNYNRK